MLRFFKSLFNGDSILKRQEPVWKEVGRELLKSEQKQNNGSEEFGLPWYNEYTYALHYHCFITKKKKTTQQVTTSELQEYGVKGEDFYATDNFSI